MTIAFDAFSKAAAVDSGNLSWTHTPSGTPAAVLVGIAQADGTQDPATAVTYGGQALTAIAGSPAIKALSGQANDAALAWWLLDASVPTGAQTVAVTVNGADPRMAYCITVTAGGAVEVAASGVAEPGPDTLSLGGATSFVAQIGQPGYDNSGSIPTGWTNRDMSEIVGDTTGDYLSCDTYDTIGSSDVTFGNDSPGGFDIYYAVAVTEAAGGGGTIVGLTTETDIALAITSARAVNVGQGQETDTALAVSPARAVAAGLATQTDTAQPVAAARAVTVGLASEADSALAVTPAKALEVGQAAETDSALSVTPARAVQVGIATETDSALALDIGDALGLASEADSALPVAAARAVQVGQASESGAALDVRPVRVVQVGVAQETDTAPGVSAARAVRVGIAAQSDTALGTTPVRLAQLGLALEIEVSLPVAPARAVTAGLASQSDVALPVSAARAVNVGIAAETGQAFALVLDLPGLGAVINPSLLSRTPDRSLYGVSTVRELASRTPRRTVHEP